MLWATSSSVAALVAHVGALRAGLVVIPANTAYTRRELAHIVTDVRPAAAVVERADQAEWVRQAAAGLDPGRSARMWISPTGQPGPLDAAAPDDPALICYTSGTTGDPKGAVLRHRNLLAATEAVRIAWGWGADDRLVHCLPLFHAHGLCVGVYGTLSAGASAVLLPGFDPGAVAEAVQDRAGIVVLRRPHHVPPAGPVREGGRPPSPAPGGVGVGAAPCRSSRRSQCRRSVRRCWSATG